ncbi:MAG TPA: cytochrome c, partial [Bryobacteraceae bacterium]
MGRSMLVLAIGISAGIILRAQTSEHNSKLTFTRDVAPILQQNCQGCHRPGEAAPFSLLTYQQARPWAKAIKSAVMQKKMPPWFADPQFGEFSNKASLSQREIDTLAAWADAGAPLGELEDMPAPRQFVEG